MSRQISIDRVIARLNIGGPAIQCLLLTRRFRDLGYQTELLSGVEGPREGNMMDFARAQQVEPIIFPGLGRELSPLRDISVLIAIYRRFRRARPTIVHTHTAKAGFVGRVAAAAARVPVRLHTFHGHVFHGYFSPAKTRLFIRLEKAMARLSSCIIVLGERQKKDILGLGIGREEQYRIVPLGLDLEGFVAAEKHRGELRRELGLQDSTPVVAIVARLVPIKNHAMFVQMARIVNSRVPEAVFLIAGDGPERDAVRDLCEASGLSSRIRMLGFRHDLARLYADSNVSVLCSHNEGMPVALIESLSSGTPVAATDVGETREIVQDGVSGFVTPPGDAEQLAARVMDMLLDPAAAARMGQAGRDSVPARFGIDRLVRDLEILYTDLAVESQR